MNGRPRMQGLADDLHETVADVATEFGRGGLTTRETCLIERLRHLGTRMDFEVSIRDYRESLDRADPHGRRMRATRQGIEDAYELRLPPLPDAVQALESGGETEE